MYYNIFRNLYGYMTRCVHRPQPRCHVCEDLPKLLLTSLGVEHQYNHHNLSCIKTLGNFYRHAFPNVEAEVNLDNEYDPFEVEDYLCDKALNEGSITLPKELRVRGICV